MAAILLSGGFTKRLVAQTDEPPKYTMSPAEAKRIIEAPARSIMLALKNRDMRRLAQFVHPRKGVRFSPYVYVDTKTARVLSRKQLVSLYASRQRLVWGEADGSGDPLRMTFRQYLSTFVYRLDLLKANLVAYNPERLHSGNTIANLMEVYPRPIIVRYFHDGITAPEGGAMDWQGLYLIFEKTGNQWYLVGIASDEWTI